MSSIDWLSIWEIMRYGGDDPSGPWPLVLLMQISNVATDLLSYAL